MVLLDVLTPVVKSWSAKYGMPQDWFQIGGCLIGRHSRMSSPSLRELDIADYSG
jgi:hypothetical protein